MTANGIGGTAGGLPDRNAFAMGGVLIAKQFYRSGIPRMLVNDAWRTWRESAFCYGKGAS
jgi:hypothetical protein